MLPRVPGTAAASRRAVLTGALATALIRPDPATACGGQLRGGDRIAPAGSGHDIAPSHSSWAPSVPRGGKLSFEVRRNGSPIGTHVLTFQPAGGGLDVNFDVSLQVRLGFITLYRYRHKGVEQWRDGRFHSLQTETNDNGRALTVTARRTAGGIVVRSTSGSGGANPETLLPALARPMSHWAMAQPGEQFFNPQTGALLRHSVQPAGRATITLANGQQIAATGFMLAGEAPIEDWYDSANLWAALDATGKDGSRIFYRRVDPV